MPTNDPLTTAAASTGGEGVDRAAGERPVLALHPVVDVTSLETLMLDASARGPQRGPAREVQNRLLAQACLCAKARGARVGLEVATGEVLKNSFLENVQGALLAAELPPPQLELAFSEADLVDAPAGAKARLRELVRWGVRLAVSDFGARYGALAYFEDLDFASVRLDASFTAKLAADLRNPHYPLAVIRGLLAVAEDLEVTVVARGVRTVGDLNLLYALGCTVQQGPFFGSATAAETLRARGGPAGIKAGERPRRPAN